MKTQTIFNAYMKLRYESKIIIWGRRTRQINAFHTAIYHRIEQGDKAREALKEVEWIFDDRSGIICPWCHGRKHYLGHVKDCPRQIALGVEK